MIVEVIGPNAAAYAARFQATGIDRPLARLRLTGTNSKSAGCLAVRAFGLHCFLVQQDLAIGSCSK